MASFNVDHPQFSSQIVKGS